MELNHVIFAIIILILASTWWFLYHRTEADLAAARAAVKIVMAKQVADLNSYNVRVELQITKLEQVRKAHNETTAGYNQFASQLKNGSSGATLGVGRIDLPAGVDRETEIVCGNAYAKVSETQRQLEACTNMVRAFLESIAFFRKKWKEQAEQVAADYPIVATNPEETYFDKLLEMPDGFANAQSMLKSALRIS
ncbi:hypothetical protein BH11CYA1_BH11CYA1_12450 [soil metagenome]